MKHAIVFWLGCAAAVALFAHSPYGFILLFAAVMVAFPVLLWEYTERPSKHDRKPAASINPFILLFAIQIGLVLALWAVIALCEAARAL